MADLVSEGREGVPLKLVASRLKQKGASEEEIEELFDLYKQLPLNEKLKVTSEGLKQYMLDVSGIQLSSEDAEKVLLNDEKCIIYI